MMSDTTLIASIPAEADNLALHVQLCEQRYLQLINKFDEVDRKFERIETMLVEIKNDVKTNQKDNVSNYLKWAGGIIFVLSTTVIGLATHLLFK